MIMSKRNAQKPKEYGPYFISEINEILTTEKEVADDKGMSKLYLVLVQVYDHLEKKDQKKIILRFDKKDVQEQFKNEL